MQQFEPATLLVRHHNIVMSPKGLPLHLQATPWIDGFVDDVWTVDSASFITGYVNDGDIAFVISSLAAAFEASTNFIIVPQAIGWYIHTDVEYAGSSWSVII